MKQLQYRDFELKIERVGDTYRADVLRSPGGEASRCFSLPLSKDRIELLILQIGQQRRRQRALTRRMHSPEMEAARELGGRLFDSLFTDEIGACFRSSLQRVYGERNTGLRLKLRLERAPELAELPWEFLLDGSSNRFLGLSVETPVVRYMELAQRISPLSVDLPLEILVMVSSPSDYAALDVERERTLLDEALEPLRGRNKVNVTYIERGTLRELRRALRKRRFHVFHFIGHGGFDRATDEGVLVLEDDDGRGQTVNGHRLATVLQNRHLLRLAVLNACEGARLSRADPYASVATALIQQGLPAVIAMQFEITDKAALAFTDELYAALVDGLPVDAAVAEGRNAIYTLPSDIEWGTPVLYMRAADGVLFEVNSPQSDEANPTPVERESLPGLAPTHTPLLRWLLPAVVAGAVALVGLIWILKHNGGDSRSGGVVERGRLIDAAQPVDTYQSTVSALTADCDSGKLEACDELADHMAATDLVGAARLYNTNCDNGHADSCHTLATWHLQGKFGTKDSKNAVALDQKACTAGSSDSCVRAAGMLAQGNGIDKDEKSAIALYVKGCDEHQRGDACMQAAIMHDSGAGSQASQIRVQRYYEKARPALEQQCTEARDGFACEDLGFLYSEGYGGDRDRTKENELYAQAAIHHTAACEAGDGPACHRLAEMHEQQYGVSTPSRDEATRLYQRACHQLHYEPACKRVNQ